MDQIDGDVRRLLEPGISVLQLRSKHLDAPQRERLGRQLLPACAEHGVPLIVNDDPGLAARIGADGVHLGREDGGIAKARDLLGAEAWVGVSCYADPERARRLAGEGATYVAFGAVYGSTSKSTPHRAPLTLFEEWRGSPVPCVAIGGIDAGNAAPLIARGVRWLAVIGAVWNAPDPTAALRAINDCFSSCKESSSP
ncbi:thiamine phosphate synthase [Lysobacter sp. CAU 1642]|uniref:Thiamine-phosphate synthase n=1 Tax=Pseudomarimonas salicorniae TaxID=2933270 RepID=A0ABT0GKT0_9GAMM|nr:thiamine phosphate synthase [Lysobacter sp. CAU 1642]